MAACRETALAFCFSQEVYEMITNFLTNSTKFLLTSLLFMSIGIAVADDDDNDPRMVDCAAGKTITDALRRARPGRPLLVIIEGTCQEDVEITADDVTLQGGSGAVDGQITIDGARRVVIDGLTVTGNGNGIQARRNAAVTVQNSTIENNAVSGIDVTQGAFALIDNNTIRSNTDCEIIVRDSGHVRMLNNTIVSNQGDSNICSAVGAFRDARIRMRGGNTVIQTATAPSPTALELDHGSTFRQDGGHDTIVGNVSIFNMTNADFRDVDITGNVDLFLNSNLRLRDQGTVPGNVTVTGNININRSNLAQFRSSAVINGNINCNGGLLFGSPNVINSPPNSINCP